MSPPIALDLEQMDTAERRVDAGALRRWHLKLLGGVYVIDDGTPRRIESSMAAVLAYLALRGRTHKYRIAGWLWPDAGEKAARANMRQLLRRVRLSLSPDFIQGTDEIALHPAVEVDLLELQRQLDAGEYASSLRHTGELLENLSFDDAPDYDEWLESERERVLQIRLRGALQASQTLAESGELAEALLHALQATSLEPVSEEAWRQVMSLNYRLGNRGAALMAFERCRLHLEERLNVSPLPETQALAQHIREMNTAEEPGLARRLLTDQSLVGRERDLHVLFDAWEKGRMTFLTGEPGVGKTALATTFARRQGPFAVFQARPGDARVPYATLSRVIREVVRTQPDLKAQLPRWVRTELGRLVPQDFDEQPEASPTVKLHLFEAVKTLWAAASQHISTLILDDIHHLDPASAEFIQYFYDALDQDNAARRWICIHRSTDVPEHVREMTRQLCTDHAAAVLHVRALTVHDTEELLRRPGVPPRLLPLASSLQAYTGGNPLYLHEVIEHLASQDADAPSMQLTPKLSTLIGERIARLSPDALLLARTVAVLNERAQLQVVAAATEMKPNALSAAWEELTNAGVMNPHGSVHDLFRDGLLQATPRAVLQLLHRSAARGLQAAGGGLLAIAHHHLSGQEPLTAAQVMLSAARQMLELAEGDKVVELHEQAAQLYEDAQEFDEAFDIRALVFEYLWDNYDFPVDAAGRLISRMHQLAVTPAQQLRVLAARVMLSTLSLSPQDDPAEISRIVREAVADSKERPFPPAIVVLLNMEILAHGLTGRLHAAAALAREALTLSADQPPSPHQASLLLDVGAAILSAGDPSAGNLVMQRAADMFLQFGERHAHAVTQHLRATYLERFGHGTEARHIREQLRTSPAGSTRAQRTDAFNQIRLAINYLHQHEYWSSFRQLQSLEGRLTSSVTGVYHRALTDFYWVVNDPDACLRAARRALEHPTPRDRAARVPLIPMGEFLAQRGRLKEAAGAFDEIDRIVSQDPYMSYSYGLLMLARARSGLYSPEENLTLSRRALELAAEHAHPHLVVQAQAETALRLFDLGRDDAAADLALLAVEGAIHAPPRNDPLLPLATLATIQGRVPGLWTAGHAQQARGWLEQHLHPENVPPEFRDTLRVKPSIQTLLKILS